MTETKLPTLHDAKKARGQWIQVDEKTEASLTWSPEEGWVLTFRLSATHEVTLVTRFHSERSIQGQPWPGQWTLQRLLDPTQWSEHLARRELRSRVGPWAGWFSGHSL